MGDINQKLCGTCGLLPTRQNRLITEDCGHQKCRKCFFNENKNCWQCNSNNEINTKTIASENAEANKNSALTAEIEKDGKTSDEYELNAMDHIKEIRSVDGIVRYHCLECNKIFNSRSQKYYHLDCNRNRRINYSCEKCEKVFVKYSYLKYHLESHTTVEHNCLQCHKTFRNRLVLRKHEKLHQMQAKKCTECLKDFRTKESLAIHIAAKHSKLLPYNCQQCDKRYACKSTLQQHCLKHQAKKYHCQLCGKAFQRNSTLNFHLKRHNENATRSCSVCCKIFTDEAALYRHIKEHQNSKRYLCTLCETTTLRKDNMLRHVRNFHLESTFEACVQIIDTLNQTNDAKLTEVKQLEASTKVIATHTTTQLITTATTANADLSDDLEDNPLLKTVENSSVIKYIGNVQPMKVPNLQMSIPRTSTSPIKSQSDDTDLIPLTTVQHFTPHTPILCNSKQPPKKLYNIELYRRILEASDNEEEANKTNQNCDNAVTDGQQSTATERPTKVHWRKSFKYNYELTEF